MKKLVTLFLSLFIALGIGGKAEAGYQPIESLSEANTLVNRLDNIAFDTWQSDDTISWDRRHSVSSWVTNQNGTEMVARNDGAVSGMGSVTVEAIGNEIINQLPQAMNSNELFIERCTTCTHQRWTQTSGPTRIQTNTNLGWHPDFPRFEQFNSYFFSTNNRTISVGAGLGFGALSISLGGNNGRTGGTINVISNGTNIPRTRPQLRGNIYRSVYRVETVVNGSGAVVGTTTQNVHTVRNQRIQITNENGTCNNNCS